MYIKRVKLKDKSTLGKWEYVLLHLAFGGSITFLFHIWIPEIFGKLALLSNDSPVWLIGCMVFVCLIGVMTTFSDNRTYSNLIGNIAAGCGLYMILDLGRYSFTTLAVVMTVTLVCSGIGIARIYFQQSKVKTESKQRSAMIRRVRFRELIRRNVCIALGICIILIPIAVSQTDAMKLYTIYCNHKNLSMETGMDSDYVMTNYYADHGIKDDL